MAGVLHQVTDVSTLVSGLSTGGAFALVFLYANLFEYVFHRWLLHRALRAYPYTYETHVRLHHRVFRGDATYHVQREEDRDLILFQWWQAPVMLILHVPALWGAQAVSGLPWLWAGLGALALYYTLYEYLHWCMHNPAGRWIERTRVFHHLDTHHRLHHRFSRINFNVVLPIADIMFGTFRGAARAGAIPRRPPRTR